MVIAFASRSRAIIALLALTLLLPPAARAALTLEPLTTFAGDGWLAPGENGFNSATDATVRGMTYNPLNDRLYVVDRQGGLNIRIFDGTTGANLGTMNTTGITGGTFALNMIDVDANGVIYAGNLSTANTSNFKIYRWADDAAAPTVAFDALANRVRTGDSFAVVGSGANTKIVAAGGSTAGEHFALFTTADGLSYSVSNPAVTGVATGAFRLGIDFAGPDRVLGKQTGAGQPLAEAPATGGAGNTYAVNSGGEGPLAWYDPLSLLATVDVNSNDVRLYDGSDLSALTTTGFWDIDKTTTGAVVANGNAVGDVKFGLRPGGELRLYALNANNGIQAFTVVPEPTGVALAGVAVLGLLARRSRR